MESFMNNTKNNVIGFNATFRNNDGNNIIDNKSDEAAGNSKEVLISRINSFINSNYDPTTELKHATLSLTTLEIFDRMQERYPSIEYNLQDIEQIMKQNNFVERERNLGAEWLLKRKMDVSQNPTIRDV